MNPPPSSKRRGEVFNQHPVESNSARRVPPTSTVRGRVKQMCSADIQLRQVILQLLALGLQIGLKCGDLFL